MTHSGAAPDAGCPWTCVIISVLYAERSCRSTGLLSDTTLLLELDGVSVARVERLADGTRRVHLVTADEAARACPTCGVFATRVKGSAVTRPRDLPYGESRLEFRWHKRRWFCREAGCARRSFTEQIAQIPAGARLTARLRSAAGRRVRDAGSTVLQAARDLHLSWPIVMNARIQAREVTDSPLPEAEVLGIDETRRGRPRREQDPTTDKWLLVRDRRHTGFVCPAAGGRR
ncbi:transposase family protein [Streptomyces avermitilis]|uniref:transposase family protein n=1 Tax=Streptomyces avermitilis TaxID=33903 RepID=UPI0033AB8F74